MGGVVLDAEPGGVGLRRRPGPAVSEALGRKLRLVPKVNNFLGRFQAFGSYLEREV